MLNDCVLVNYSIILSLYIYSGLAFVLPIEYLNFVGIDFVLSIFVGICNNVMDIQLIESSLA